MRTASLTVFAASLLVVLSVSGCGRSAAPTTPRAMGPSGLTQQAANDLARQFGATLSRQGLPLDRVGSTSLVALARGTAPDLRRSGPMAVTDEGGFAWSLSVTFFDAAGVPQLAYVPGVTARVVVVARARGNLVTAEHRAFVGLHRRLDVQGLLPVEEVLLINGAAHDTADCEFQARDGSASRSYHLLAAGALNDVRKLKDESVNPWPLSGTARWEVQVDAFVEDERGAREAHYQATVLVTFNGTRHPVIEINERWRYRMDLETGEVERLPA
jgi:hypothetical protein